MKSYLRAAGYPVTASHLHVEIASTLGVPIYNQVAREFEIGEGIYCALLYPESREEILGRIGAELRRKKKNELAHWLLTTAIADVKRATHRSIDAITFGDYDLAGFSVGAIQQMASLYIASVLRDKFPQLTIVFGGSGIIGEVGRNMMKEFPFIDFLVDGEGEEALLKLVQRLSAKMPVAVEDGEPIDNLWYRDASGAVLKSAQSVMPSLEHLPEPDFEEYFNSAQRLGYPATKIVLPIEASRGCEWEHRCGDGSLQGCTFCGLYRNSPDFRQKTLPKVLSEIRTNTDRYTNLNLSFVDAYLPSAYRLDLLKSLATMPMDISIFCEMRCDLDDETGRLLAANSRRVQLGVESFSDRILRRLEKGRKTIDNIHSMKICEEYNVPYQYNIISEIPGVSAQEVEEMAELLPLLFGFRPPSVSTLVLDRGSRMFREPEKHGIRSDSIDAVPLSFLPRSLARSNITQTISFEAIEDPGEPSPWLRIDSLVGRWNAVYEGSKQLGFRTPLTFREGAGFVSIADNREDGLLYYTLEGALKNAFLAAGRKITVTALAKQLSRPVAETEEILDVLHERRLIYRDGISVISLPVREQTKKNLLCAPAILH